MLTENALCMKNQLGDMWPILRADNTYWHSTNIERFKKIYHEGIRPSDDTIASDYPYSLGAYFKSVCLFNFFSGTEEMVLEREDCWGGFLVGKSVLRIFLEIDGKRLDSKHLIDTEHKIYRSLHESENEAKYKNRIPYVENWYQNIVPVSAIRNVFLIRSSGRPFTYKVMSVNSTNLLQKTDELNAKWAELDYQKKLEDRKNGKLDLAELLAEADRIKF